MSVKKKVIIILGAILLAIFLYAGIDALVIQFSRDSLKYNIDKIIVGSPAEYATQNTADYYDYLESKEQNFPQGVTVSIGGDEMVFATDYLEIAEYEGKQNVLQVGEEGTVEYEFQVNEAGFYQVYLNYYPILGKSVDIERIIYINGQIPFEGAKTVTFKRIWGGENDGEIKQDVGGNDIRPSQIETPFWTGQYIKDSVGYVADPYMFYLESGKNTITFESVREPILIESVEIRSVRSLPKYEELKAQYDILGYQVVNQPIQIEQAEDSDYTTSPTLYPINDRTSAKTYPNDPTKIKLNSIGGTNWRTAGDLVHWSFTVPESGLYAISMRLKQNIASGMVVSRDIYIDGEIPFEELQGYCFVNNNSWRMQTLGTKDDPFLFYFEVGTHEIAMEVTLGQYGPLVAQLQNSMDALNKLYRRIIIYTGPQPDQYRDYDLLDRIKDLLEILETERDNLTRIRNDIVKLGSKSEKTGIIDQVTLQLKDFLKKPNEIHKKLSSFNTNISSLGTLIILLKEQPIELDYFVVHNPESSLPVAKANSFESFVFGFRAFIATFYIDYTAIGREDTGASNATIEVWLSTGKDQANILRKLIDESFSPQDKHGIQVDLKLVSGAALLPATLAGKGPDVSLWTGGSTPVNYAMRNAAYDLSQFDDFDTITKRFKESALVPFTYNKSSTESGVYALPEQQTFLMMFYRTDIFNEIGLTPPETWDDIIKIVPTLQERNLEFYLPVPSSEGSTTALAPNPIFSSMFYQRGGEFYVNGDWESGFSEGTGPEVFKEWTQFYTDYSFSVDASFINRFRSGQMPIGISYYNTYNTLSVFAPEIRGKWDFCLVPGTKVTDENGVETIRRDTVASTTGAMILSETDYPEESWEFLKWWTSTETQVKFGREMEGILGAAARYPTANVEAMAQLPWTVKELAILEEQWKWVRGIPEVPGGYLTGRHLDNAFRLVYNERANPRETILDYVEQINAGLAAKRNEFGLE
ncbi:extracellular solute-binding protein [Acholeplasma sp. OttesenSCG-928-E16]|nr:extracellular solute-binding protein [Acholeplasma sp. OttesenSCG-928-E16]